MNIKKITLHNVMGHANYALDLPPSGVVLVTGPNGVGKSSVVEALPIAMWGKTLRGTSPWHTKKQCHAIVEVDELAITRTRKGARSVVEVDGEGVPEFDTAAKALDWLAHLHGSFDAWRRTHVFSSHDAAHFTMATDAERKHLLESLLGLGKFDDALRQCRADLKERKRSAATAESAVNRAQDSVSHMGAEAERLLEQLQEVGSSVDLEALAKDVRKYELSITEWEAEVSAVRDQVSALQRLGVEQAAELKTKMRQLAAIDHAACPTCGQDIPDELKQPLREEIGVLKQSVERAVQARDAELLAAKDEQRGLIGELEEHRRALRDTQREKTVAEQEAQVRQGLDTRVELAKQRVEAAEETLRTATTAFEKEAQEVATLDAVSTVLGMRGVRAQILGKTLAGLELVANLWLSRIAGPQISISLSPYTEKKTGGVSDAIQMVVEGAGGGHGYRAASGGERRRIDVAVLLALADIAAATSQSPGGGASPMQGTLFFDEVFDTLDSDGLESVIAITHELAQDRAVVVISHSEELGAKLNPAVHVRM